MALDRRGWVLVCGLLLLQCLAAVSLARAQSNTFFNQRDDQYRLLGLKRAKEAHDVARAELARMQALFDDGHLSITELERQRRLFSDAEDQYAHQLSPSSPIASTGQPSSASWHWDRSASVAGWRYT